MSHGREEGGTVAQRQKEPLGVVAAVPTVVEAPQILLGVLGVAVVEARADLGKGAVPVLDVVPQGLETVGTIEKWQVDS